jgi:hypothetical protein
VSEAAPDDDRLRPPRGIEGEEPGRPILLAAAVIGCIVLTRAFLLASPESMANPDECLVGVMAIERSKGLAPSIFVWGQHYGLSFFEVELAALAFSLFGIGMATLKAAMLVPFGVGTLFLCAWMRRAHGERAAWVAGLLVALCPAYLPFSTQAHGGYLTAFAAMHFAIWLTWTQPRSPTARIAKTAAFVIAAAIVVLGQPLFFVFLLAMTWLHPRAPSSWFARGAPIVLAVASAAVVRHFGSQTPLAHRLDPFAQTRPLEQLLMLPERLLVAFSGRHLLNHPIERTVLATLAGLLLLALLATAAVHAVATLRGARERGDATGKSALIAALVVSAAATGVNVVAYGARYLLPVIESTVVLAARLWSAPLAAQRPRIARAGRILAVLAGLAGAAATLETARDPRVHSGLFRLDAAERRSLEAVLADLDAAGVKHAYVLNGMLKWTLMFESKGEIVTRYFWQIDRRMDFPPIVDRALREGKPTAIVGRDVLELVRQFVKSRGIEDRLVVHDERWYYILNPDEELVKAMNFRLASP